MIFGISGGLSMKFSQKEKKELMLFFLILLMIFAAGFVGWLNIQNVYYGYRYSKLISMEKKTTSKNKSLVLKDLKIAEKGGNPPYSFIPVGSFHGKLKKTGTVKVVFGLAGKHKSTVAETFGNIYYIFKYLKFHHIKYKLALVIYGAQASRLGYKQMGSPDFNNSLRIFHEEGLKIYVCYNALMINHEIGAMIPKFVHPVPMGVLKIYELRKTGYIYFTNP